MRFLHTGDIHLGAVPDRGKPWSRERSEAIRNTFQQLVETAGREQADLLLIAGDLFHRQPLLRECREADYCFSTIPHTEVVIIAGNHDYIESGSPWLTFTWSKNVHILSGESMQSVYFPKIQTEVHGFSYHCREITEPLYDSLTVPKDGRRHILLAHGGDETHIPIHMDRLAKAGFDYVALGHIHQPRIYKHAAIAYCGSPEPMDKSDIGKRGYILGEMDENGCRYHWHACASCQYRTITLTVNRDTTTSQIIDKLKNGLDHDPKFIYRLRLTGFRSPDVTFDTNRMEQAARLADVTDLTAPAYDLDRLRAEHSCDLISRYIDALSRPDASEIEKKALNIGLNALLQPEKNH